MFNPRGTDVPVVLDLMVHDIDIILDVIKSPIKNISVSGVSIVSPTPDITNARIEFENGSVANLTASRISLKNMRRHRIFQKDAYITVDFLDKKTDIVRINNVEGEISPLAMTIDLADGTRKQITIEQPEVTPINAIMTELESFHNAIVNNTEPPVTIHDGVQALKVCYMILDEIVKNQEIVQNHLK
jgi:predicted dehydrogenase